MDFSRLSQLGLKARWERDHKPIREHIKNNHKNLVKEKARLIGFIMGDGSVSSIRDSKDKIQHHDITFYPDDFSLAETFIKDFQKLYLKKPFIKKEKNYFSLRASSKPAWEDLRTLGDFSSLNWIFPKKLNSNEEKREWLRAFFDCEAYVGKRNIQLQSVSREGIDSIKKLLKEFNINSKIYKYERKNKNWNTTFILCIMKKEDRIKYFKSIGFNHLLKQHKLKNIIVGMAEW